MADLIDMSEQITGGEGSGAAHARPRNWLHPFLLLSLAQWQSYGYELMRRLTLFGFDAVDPGSVYRALRRLERDGLVRSDWDTAREGPARRMYRLTDAGQQLLETWASALRDYQSMLERFFDMYSGTAGTGSRPESPSED